MQIFHCQLVAEQKQGSCLLVPTLVLLSSRLLGLTGVATDSTRRGYPRCHVLMTGVRIRQPSNGWVCPAPCLAGGRAGAGGCSAMCTGLLAAHHADTGPFVCSAC